GSGLPDLLAHDLAYVADALALVDVGCAERADVGGHLADRLLVRALDAHADLLLDADLDPFGDREPDRMRVAQGEDDVLAFDLRLVSDSLDLEILREPVRNAFDRIRDEAAHETMQRPVLLLVRRALDLDVAVVDLGGDPAGQRHGQLSLGALDGHRATGHGDLHALGDRDGFSSDSRHRVLGSRPSFPCGPYQTVQSTSPPIP